MSVGSVIGIWNTSSGRVLTAFRAEQETKAMFERLKKVIGEPNVKFKDFYNDIQTIKMQGFDVRPSDIAEGIVNISFPIFDSCKRAVAAIHQATRYPFRSVY